jgi:hypothetical protein
MAGRKKKGGKQPQKAAPAAPAPTPVAKRRDLRPYIYYGLDQVFVAIYAYVITAVIPNRMMSGQIHLWTLPILMQVVAAGMATSFQSRPEARRIGWWLAVVGASLLLLTTILLIIRVLISAAFLSGVYGAFGKAAAMSALIGVALVVELVALLPLFQLKYLMTRAGRSVFARA